MGKRSSSCNARIALLLLITRVLLYICGIVGICMLFTKNKRIDMIQSYNQRIREWESEGVIQLENMSFYISYRNISQDYDLVTEGFGEFYPFRDRCDKKYDPECLNSSVYYYSTSLPILYDQDSVVLISSVDGFAVFNETVKFQDMIYLNKKEIGCSGDNTEVCSNACSRRYGEWDTSSNLCKIHMYLSSINLRIYYDNITDSFQLDDPPHASWLPADSNFGCEPFSSSNLYRYHDSSPWPPFIYSSTPSPSLSTSLRHFRDPFIAAATITDGCSASSLSAANCFGKSIEEDRFIALFLIGLGVLGLAAALIIIVTERRLRRKHGRAPSWLTPFGGAFALEEGIEWNDEAEELKGRKGHANDLSSEWRKETVDNLESTLPVLNLLDETPVLPMDLNESESILSSSNYNLRPEFEGDATGI